MSNLSMFFAENAVNFNEENVKFVASKRFVDEKKKPIPWEIKKLGTKENKEILKQCTKRVPVAGKPNQFTTELDDILYSSKIAVACTVFPNLHDAALQDSYKVKSPEDLLDALLPNAEESGIYLNKVREINNTSELESAVEEAKN